MKNRYQNQLVVKYKEPFLNMLQVPTTTGFVRLYIIDRVTGEPIPYSMII